MTGAVLQIRVVLGAAHALPGRVRTHWLQEGRRYLERRRRRRRRFIRRRLRRQNALLPLLPFGLASVPGVVHLRGRLHDDGGPLPQILPVRRLGGHDGLCAVHPGRGSVVEVAVGVFPAPQLRQVLFLDVFLRYGQLYGL